MTTMMCGRSGRQPAVARRSGSPRTSLARPQREERQAGDDVETTEGQRVVPLAAGLVPIVAAEPEAHHEEHPVAERPVAAQAARIVEQPAQAAVETIRTPSPEAVECPLAMYRNARA